MKNYNGHRNNLREKFLRAGFQCLNNHEILELILTLCIPRKDVKPQAKELLRYFGSLNAVLDADIETLQEVKGVGRITAISLHIIKDSAALYVQKSVEDPKSKLDTFEELEKFWRIKIGGLSYEVFEVAYLDSRLRLIKNGIKRISEGIADRTNVLPRKIVDHALRKDAAALVIAHNHPAGSETPSIHDRLITKSLSALCEPLCLRLVDHLIITNNSIFSFKKANML
ncbi:MAG: DNA repair protein RadC [Puniceicoccales bacterium]|jgi:DNA repair protein RadC|nr:DNA repair protein RadC [Puniceicoccales bacterium]